jgi:DNA-binding SARP family transcriptional activator/tetratricopeptide (TPR) repeat protein
VSGLRVRLLGHFEIEGVESQRLGSRKARTLLKILALARGRPVAVDFLVECLWPDGLPAKPATQVAVLVSRLRAVLGTDQLVRSDAGYALVADWLDVDAVTQLGDEAARRLGMGSHALARVAAAAALTLARGSLLEDEPEAPWAQPDRAAAARLVTRVRHTAAEAAMATAAWADAAELGRRALDADPYDEGALRIIMAALACSGRPSSALGAYAEFRARLEEDLGVGPGAKTETLHTDILLEHPLGIPTAVDPLSPRRLAGLDRNETVLPGRAHELEVLDAALARAANGLELLVVDGEAGIGKTRLVRAWADQVEAAGGTVLWGRCDELGRMLPLQAVLDALRSHVRLLATADLRAVLGPEAPVMGPLLSVAEQRATGIEWLGPTDSAAQQAVLFAAIRAVIGRLSRLPLAIVLDDVHLADASTLAWLAFASRRRDDLRALIVVTRRTGEGGALPPAEIVALGPLDLAATEAVVGPQRAAELHARSGGNPLLLAELSVAEPGERLPASVVEIVTARCLGMGEAGLTLRTAAVIGAELDLDLLVAVLARPPVELLEHLEQGVGHRFLDERGAQFAFRHELVREALAAGTRRSRRAMIHREVARTLASRSRADPIVVAHHAGLGGEDELAAAAWARAAAVAFDRHDHPEAERFLDEAVAKSDSPTIRLQRARVRLALGHYQAAAEDAGAALAHGAGAAGLELAGWAAYYERDFRRARSLADDGARLADDQKVRAGCLALGGRIRHSDGDVVGADRRLSQAVELAHGAIAPLSSMWLGALRVHQGRPDEALDLLSPATRPGTSLGHPFAMVYVHLARGHALASKGRASDALAAFDAASAEIDRQQADRFAGRPENYRAWVLRNLGAGEEADELNWQALEAAEKGGYAEATAHALLDLAESRLRRGALEEAAALVGRVGSLGPVYVNRWRADLRARLLGARLALAHGSLDEAAVLAAAVGQDARALSASRYVVLGRLVHARSRVAAREPEDLNEVARLLDRLVEVAGLEAWWLVAELAGEAGVDAWMVTAERHLATLVRAAGPYADVLSRWAGPRLETIRTESRSG